MPNLKHVGLLTGTIPLPLAREFYTEILGAEMVYNKDELWRFGPHRLRLRICKLKLNGSDTLIELIEAPPDMWRPHISIEVDEFPEKLKIMNLKRLYAPKNHPEVCYAEDLCGNAIELVKK